jgi:hypothetical protein
MTTTGLPTDASWGFSVDVKRSMTCLPCCKPVANETQIVTKDTKKQDHQSLRS